jgi:hypothetical protein
VGSLSQIFRGGTRCLQRVGHAALPPDILRLRRDSLPSSCGQDDPPKFLKFFFPTVAFLLYKTAPEEFINPVSRQVPLCIAILAMIVSPASADLFPESGPVVSAKTAHLRFGRAAAPKHAPLAVKRAIWAANQTSLQALSVRRRSQIV